MIGTDQQNRLRPAGCGQLELLGDDPRVDRDDVNERVDLQQRRGGDGRRRRPDDDHAATSDLHTTPRPTDERKEPMRFGPGACCQQPSRLVA
jgi:hypothetical protein